MDSAEGLNPPYILNGPCMQLVGWIKRSESTYSKINYPDKKSAIAGKTKNDNAGFPDELSLELAR